MEKTVWKGYVQTPRQGVHHNGAPCQDYVCLKENDDVLVVALSDGLGSLRHSDIASKTAATEVANFLASYSYNKMPSKEQFASEVIALCRKAVEDEAAMQGLDIESMDCTLLFAVLFKNSNGCITGQLGDGAICLIKPDSATQVPPAASGAKAGANMTKTLFSTDATAHFSLDAHKAEDVVGILLTSDGLQHELYSEMSGIKNNLQWYYNSISTKPAEDCELLISKRWHKLSTENANEFSDDMSLAVIYRPGQEINLPKDANWLCLCGHRNNLESTRCTACSKDFLKLYKGAPYRDYGGKKQLFLYLNANPEEEQNMLHKLSTYAVPSTNSVPSMNYVSENTEVAEEPVKPFHPIESVSEPEMPQAKAATSKTSENKLPGLGQTVADFCTSFTKRLGSLANAKKSQAEPHRADSRLNQPIKKATEAQNKQQNAEKTRSPEALLSSAYHECYTYPNGDIYLGDLKNGLPDGIGLLLTPSLVYAGTFTQGKKDGRFYLFKGNQNVVEVVYEDDVMIVQNR